MSTVQTHHRTPSSPTRRSMSIPRSPSPPTQTFHPGSILPRSVPTPSLVESVAGAAHYSGIRVDPEPLKHRHSAHERRASHFLDVKADHHRVMADLRELYCCRPTIEILDRTWHKDAVFEDPWTKCHGFDEYAAQWFSLPKLYSKSETLSTRVMSSTNSPNQLVYFQKQEYTHRFLGRKKIVESIIVVNLDENDKIIRLVEQHGGKDIPAWFGAHLLRRLSAKVTPWLITIPKRSV
ncbi:hypothetical protein EYR40_001102 [Pleurotus pulmonarius]|nr:hypothetical protein EYR36_004834 [Pleurotus pulmonarius]KAF4578741.1 hypothetical protein EYR36_000548 [Pleurotus pulmonarius]KAF4603928.1 hypothetical protein EYR38_004344 [Pleurotus pulmonarius]KAF4608755.1 hypothetical protein EYR40_001102 [Pleurotus pulmonarius]